jgi:hypothetical protein
MSFFSICWERNQLGGACFVRVPANVVCLYKWAYPSAGFVVLCVSDCAVFHTSRPLLSFWQNYLISVGLSRLHCLHHGCASHPTPTPGNLWTLTAIYVPFTFIVSTPSLHFVSKFFFWKWNSGKPWMTRISTWKVTAERNQYSDPKQPGTQLIQSRYLRSDRGTQLINPGSRH